jgi:predicted acylesterase/phospholipase RssA
MAATCLVGHVWLVIYLSQYISNSANLDTTPRGPGWDPPRLWVNPSRDAAEFSDYRSALQYLAAVTPPFLLVLLLIGAFPAEVPGRPAMDPPTCGRRRLGVRRRHPIGTASVVLYVRIAWALVSWLGRFGLLRRLVTWSSIMLRMRSHATTGITGFDPRLETAVAGAFWGFLLADAFVVLIPLNWCLIVPSLAISVLLILIASFYFVLISLRRALQLPLVALLLLFVIWSNSGPYKYRFPGMGCPGGISYYDAANLVPAGAEVPAPDPAQPLLRDEAVLDRWKARLGEEKPKLVLLAVPGGAYRAGFWTAAVLDELERRSRADGDLEGLTDRIRVITGASGGMVGAAYFAAQRTESGPRASVVGSMLADAQRNTCRRPRPSSPDSLTPIVQQLVQRDIPMIFCPIAYQKVDRGVILERQWCAIDRSFSSLRDGEAAGWRPSLVVSPMIIETGERLLISNLELSEIAHPISETNTGYLRTARQFFRMFPAAQPNFNLRTAIRMSATFPYASPAVSLPTTPPLRVVDAGYYDNYGVNLAAAWAYQNRDWIFANTSGVALIQIYAYSLVQGGGEDMTGKPKPGEKATSPAGAKLDTPVATPAPPDPAAGLARRAARDAGPGETAAATAGQAFHWLSSPIEGGLAARNLSMLYRNEEQLRLLDDTFNQIRIHRLWR